jgi:4-alpha-glucanotransferase
MPFTRASGILLHPTSLPSPGGLGDLGPAAYEFLDFLTAARQRLWQVLPLAPAGLGNSPYSATSAFAGNPLLISLERLAERGWLAPTLVRDLPEPSASVDYPSVRRRKLPLLREAARNFLAAARGAQHERYERFRRESAAWLEDFALYDALRSRHGEQAWNRWPSAIAHREPAALDRAREYLAEDVEIVVAIQFFFFEQWNALHREARRRGIRLVGDAAIFVSCDSADVWAHREIFTLREDDLEPYVVAGVPPDLFSKTGQRWGDPLYRWDALAARGYDWWIERVRAALRTCDLLRLDHFRGFEQYWEIPAGEPTAVNGRWQPGPGDDLFRALSGALGELPLIAEDLGYITPEVHALRCRWNIPGMKVLQFAFGDPGAHIYLPHRYETNCAVYTGTHDNDTVRGWWESGATDRERRLAQAYFGHDPEGMNWAFIRGALASPAVLAIFPLQDALGLGSEGRMNVPSRPDGNWTWRFSPDALAPHIAERLAMLAEVTDRDADVSVPPVPQPSEEYCA